MAILSGTLADGERLPSLSALATRYSVSTDIARQAVAKLRAEHLVVIRHGAGAFVSRFALITRSSPARLSGQSRASGTPIQDHDTGPRPRSVDVVVREAPAPDYVAVAFAIKAGAAVLSRSRRFLVEERPVQLSTSYLPLKLVRGTPITYTDTGTGGLYARLADLGHAPVRFVEKVTCRAPDPDERIALLLGSTGLVFQVVRFAYTAAERCVEVNRMILDASAYELEYGFPA